MEITEVRISLRDSAQTRLRAYVTVTFDRCFVVRNLKVIDGKNGLFVAMPSRKAKVACMTCQFKHEVGNRYCSQCGAAVTMPSTTQTPGAGDLESQDAMSPRDIAHPITAEFRQYLQKTVLEAYEAEKSRGGGGARPSSAVESDCETL